MAERSSSGQLAAWRAGQGSEMAAGSDIGGDRRRYRARARRPATFQALGGAVAPNLDKQLELD